ncbi:MAG: universal stress protein UspA [Gallionellales bacterium RIFCSPLOWO2_12_FULL_59_22]|nr:MAG: universal stress protein UspA [Gallionellales bacterium RIFCSPLOWO2_02_FULL_59_110]OGT01376.1 MAG: universal stress protein UspA [Gallionellales bacterium RIFCSPLOWO2_02_58_13]OGT14473.1 MAG: universal stress protein UspA [Gallionellales bacterium RIFCSPLOWO2_12_FULL_59_22]
MKILIPVDGSTNAQRAVDYVIGSVAALKEPPQLLLLNVQWNVAAGNVKLFIDQQTIDNYYREQGMAALQAARAALDAVALPYQYHISVGTPAEAIVQYAGEQGVDQIVMGRQGQGGLQALLLGSVVNKVLHLANCPVVLIK